MPFVDLQEQAARARALNQGNGQSALGQLAEGLTQGVNNGIAEYQRGKANELAYQRGLEAEKRKAAMAFETEVAKEGIKSGALKVLPESAPQEEVLKNLFGTKLGQGPGPKDTRLLSPAAEAQALRIAGSKASLKPLKTPQSIGEKAQNEALIASTKEVSKKNEQLGEFERLLGSDLKTLKDPKQSEEQKLVTANMMLKTLNSAAVAQPDVVGAEEANRMGSLLKYHIANISQPGPFAGRAPISDFITQVENKIKSIKDTREAGHARLSEMTGQGKQKLTPEQRKNLINSIRVGNSGR